MNRMYKIDAFIPEAGEIKSIKESLQKQIEQCTNRNGIKVFLTVSEQIQAKRYIPKWCLRTNTLNRIISPAKSRLWSQIAE